MSIPVHRNADSRVCGAATVVTGQSTVFANGRLVSVQGDPNTHGGGNLGATVNPGTVIIEGKEMVVVGSHAASDSLCPPVGPPHCDPISSSGSPNVEAF